MDARHTVARQIAQHLHLADPGIEPAQIAALRHLSRCGYAAAEAILPPRPHLGVIIVVRRAKVGDDDVADLVGQVGAFAGIADLHEIAESPTRIVYFATPELDRRRWAHVVAQRIEHH